jgi:HYR domain
MKTAAVVLALVILAFAAPASATRGRAAGTLQLPDTFLKGSYDGSDCPQGTPDGDLCWTINTKGLVRGLGVVTAGGVLVVSGPHTDCEVWTSMPTLTVAGKGTIALSVKTPSGTCFNGAGGPVNAGLLFTVTGGTGAYAGASGSGAEDTTGVGLLQASDTLSGTIVAPATTFDLTPPVISGVSKIVRAPKGKKSVRVRYAVSANDAVDGPVSATCAPASGSSFRVGHTRVRCTATDSSANTATVGFTITVKR